jgi:hypothetical protein
MIARVGFVWLFSLALAAAQTKLTPDVIRLARIKNVMADYLRAMPNFTCLETVERFQRPIKAKKDNLIDVLRLEVALVDGKELYAWPGSKQFEDKSMRDLITSGAFGTGSFALHAKAIFLGDGTQFTYKGEVEFEGQPAWHYEIYTPQMRSGYGIRNSASGMEAVVPYKGSFWVSRQTLEVLRLDLLADVIPPALEISRASDELDYERMQIGQRDALLPAQSEMRITDNNGNVNINRIRLSRCKAYSGESTISFDDITEGNGAERKAKTLLQLPENVELDLALTTPVEHGVSAVGDAVEATLRREVKRDKRVLLPKGSIFRGRLLRLERQRGNISSFNVAFLFDEVETPDSIGRVNLELLSLPGAPPTNLRGGGARPTIVPVFFPEMKRNGLLVMRDSLLLEKGFTTIWQTQKVLE